MTKVQQITVSKDDNDIRIDRWFKRNFPKVSHTSIEKALRKGQIKVDGKKVKSNHKIQTGNIIRVPPLIEYTKTEKPTKQINEKHITELQKSVIFKDEDIIVINKPAGLAVQGGEGVKISIDDMLDHLKFDATERPKLVHRLDKDTSGVLLIARKTSIASKLAGYFKSKEIEKTYWALVVGTPDIKEGKIDLPLMKKEAGSGKEKIIADKDGQKAITYYKVLENIGNKLSLVELYPETGRTHQLRVHMNEIGHPILGDGKYGGKSAFIDGLSNKMHLHARSIKIPLYKQTFTANLIDPMQKTFETLGMEQS